MEHSKIHGLTEQLLEQCKYLHQDAYFQRTVNGDTEDVSFLPDSSIRIWFNEFSCEYPLHWHPAHEIIIPLENSYTVEIGSDTYKLQPGDVFIIPGGTLHYLIAPPTGKRLIILFDFTVLSKIHGFSFLSSCVSQPALLNRDTCRTIYNDEMSLLSTMLSAYITNGPLTDMTIYSQLITFFINYAHYRLSTEQANQPGAPHIEIRQQEVIDKFSMVFDFLDEHYMEDITLEDVANVAGFSKFYFSRLFKQYQNCNFYDYLCLKRIKSAENLLMKPGASITEIALQSGFSSLSTFNRTFKKLKGCTPSEYRNLYRSTLSHHPEGRQL